MYFVNNLEFLANIDLQIKIKTNLSLRGSRVNMLPYNHEINSQALY